MTPAVVAAVIANPCTRFNPLNMQRSFSAGNLVRLPTISPAARDGKRTGHTAMIRDFDIRAQKTTPANGFPPLPLYSRGEGRGEGRPAQIRTMFDSSRLYRKPHAFA